MTGRSPKDLARIADAWEACPQELRDGIAEFFPRSEWAHASAIAHLESGFDAFALHDSTSESEPCGTPIGQIDGVTIYAERSVGYFQLNSCNWPNWEWQRFYNARHNAGTAHALFDEHGWAPWYFSARALGLL